jgi:predicted dehydrogenase
MQSKKILVIGLGSIGTRHFNNLKTLGFDDIVLVSSKQDRPAAWAGHQVFPKLDQALAAHHFTHAFVCSPTASHVGQLKELVKAKVSKIYLEKPISHNLDDLEQFKTALTQGIQILVGYDLHFDPGLIKVRELLQEKAIGKVYSANAFVGQYLPDWRPYEDHRKGMSASLEHGGGVMLDLIHEFDYLIWLLGSVQIVSAIYQENPELEIETEDVADVLIRFESGATGTIHLDYHQRVLIRNCVFTGALGTIKWDLAARTVTLTQADKKAELFDFSGFERNDRYLEIAKAFMDEDSDDRICTFEHGLESLQLVMASKISSQSNSTIKSPLFK